MLMSVLHSCNKYIVDDYPEESNCDRFAGKYLMYDPVNDTNYELIIDCIPYESQYTYSEDTVFYNNFANLFSFGHRVDSEKHLVGTIIQPLTDKYGKRWNFSNGLGPSLENRINVLVGDSLYVGFTMDNTAFWIDDGVPYQSITSVHSGIKIH